MKTFFLRSAIASCLLVTLLTACSSGPVQRDSAVAAQARDEHADGQDAFSRHDFDSARRHFQRALRLHQSIDDAQGIALNRLDLARSWAALGEGAKADAELDALLSSAASASARAEAARQKAVIALAEDRLDDALRWQSEAASQCGADCSLGGSLAMIRAQVALRRGAFDQAQHEWNTAQAALPSATPPTAEQANLWRLGGQIARARKDFSAARSQLAQALATDRDNGLPDRVQFDLRLLAENAEASADRVTARDYYRRLLDAALSTQRDADPPSATVLYARAGLQRLEATLAKENP